MKLCLSENKKDNEGLAVNIMLNKIPRRQRHRLFKHRTAKPIYLNNNLKFCLSSFYTLIVTYLSAKFKYFPGIFYICNKRDISSTSLQTHWLGRDLLMHQYKARVEKHYLKLLHNSKTADSLALDLQAIERSDTLNVSSFQFNVAWWSIDGHPFFERYYILNLCQRFFTFCNQLLYTQLLTVFHTKQVHEKNKWREMN